MGLLIKNIHQLVQVREKPIPLVKGKEMSHLPVIENAWLLIKDGIIADYGEMASCPQEENTTIIDAQGRLVLPCWCDSHTHLVYAGSREMEFVDKIKGLTYEEIARNGGGILNSSDKMNRTDEEELFDQAKMRLKEIMAFGTGAVEIKSGYGLSLEGELKMLRVIKRLKETSPLTIKATFLGAHAIPRSYLNNREGYIKLIIEEMIPKVASEGLAEYCDVFCDKGFFSADETDLILSAAVKAGLIPKIHANELDYSGGIQVGVKHKALSVDHLEYTGDEEIQLLKASNTMPTLLPSTAFFLNLKNPPARKMIDEGLPVALASDYNPGSSPSGRMQFVLSLGCINLKMTPEEVINAATINGAFAMGLSSSHGSITKGKKANLIITKPCPSYQYLPYAFGNDLIDKVIFKGNVYEG